MTNSSEVPSEIDSLFLSLGGFIGNSGNQGYSEDIAGVINLCGALGDTAWINPAIQTPIVSMHGTDDTIVPYGTDTVTLFDIGLVVDGSASIHNKLDQSGIENDFYTFQGAGHTPFVLNQAYMDTTIWFVRDFLYDLVCDGITSVSETSNKEDLSLSVFPNPNNGNFYVRLDSNDILDLSIFDALGKMLVSDLDIHQGLNRLELDLPPGIYILHLYSTISGESSIQKIIIP